MQISQIPAGNESSDVLYGLQALQDCKHMADAARQPLALSKGTHGTHTHTHAAYDSPLSVQLRNISRHLRRENSAIRKSVVDCGHDTWILGRLGMSHVQGLAPGMIQIVWVEGLKGSAFVVGSLHSCIDQKLGRSRTHRSPWRWLLSWSLKLALSISLFLSLSRSFSLSLYLSLSLSLCL